MLKNSKINLASQGPPEWSNTKREINLQILTTDEEQEEEGVDEWIDMNPQFTLHDYMHCYEFFLLIAIKCRDWELNLLDIEGSSV